MKSGNTATHSDVCQHHWQIETAIHDGISVGVCTRCGVAREHIGQWERMSLAKGRVPLAMTPTMPYIKAWVDGLGMYDPRRC